MFGGGGELSVLPDWGFTGMTASLPSLTIIIGMTVGTMFGVYLGHFVDRAGHRQRHFADYFCRQLLSVPFQIRQLAQNPLLLGAFVLITVLTVALIVCRKASGAFPGNMGRGTYHARESYDDGRWAEQLYPAAVEHGGINR